LTRTVIESGSVKSSEREIPVTLHDSLMARLDRLGPAKEVAQLGAVIGSEFSYELLEAVSSTPTNALQAALAKVADAELIYARGIPPEATYKFKHALIRDAAYEALLKSRRKDLHRLIAQTISEKFPAFKASRPEVLARHWAEAGETEEAIAEWSRASKAAEARNALVEALESLQQALALLNPLPESPEVQTMASPTGGGSGANDSPPANSSRRRGSPDVFPLLPLRGLVAFPHVSYPIFLGRPKSIKAAAHAYQHSAPILLVTQREPYPADPARYDMYEIGTIAAVVETLALPDGTMKSVVEGMGRARVSRFIFAEEFFEAEAEPIEEPTVSDTRLESLTKSVLSAFLRQRVRAVSQGANQPEAFGVSAITADGVSVLVDRTASESRIELASKQTLLEILDPLERMEKLLAYLSALG